MKLDEIRKYCLSLKGVTEDIKWENHLCFSVGDKMFIVTAPDDVPVSASFKTNDELFEELPAREGMIPAPYMAKNKWIKIDDVTRLSKKEWVPLLDLAYELIFSKLTKKKQNEILNSNSKPQTKLKTVSKTKSKGKSKKKVTKK